MHAGKGQARSYAAGLRGVLLRWNAWLLRTRALAGGPEAPRKGGQWYGWFAHLCRLVWENGLLVNTLTE